MQQSNKADYNLWQNKTEANFLLSGGEKRKRKNERYFGKMWLWSMYTFFMSKVVSILFLKTKKTWVRIN